jgi:hypothetical protein
MSSNVKMPEPEISLYVQCANGMQIPVRSFSEVQMQAYAQAVRDEALEEAIDHARRIEGKGE